jgi:hypothetical protein
MCVCVCVHACLQADSESLIRDLHEELTSSKADDAQLRARCKELESSLEKDWAAEYTQLEAEKERLEFEARSRALELSREKKKVALLQAKLDGM